MFKKVRNVTEIFILGIEMARMGGKLEGVYSQARIRAGYGSRPANILQTRGPT